MKRALLGAAALAAALLLVAGAGAATPSVTSFSVTAGFSNAVEAEATPASYAAMYCPPETPDSVNRCTTSPVSQVRWGDAGGGQRSGLGFQPTSATTEPLNTNFVVGILSHFNFPVYYPIKSVVLSVHITAHSPTDGNITFDVPFTLTVDETTNTPPCTYHITATDPPCPDAIMLPAGGVHTTLSTGGPVPHHYTLNVLGFTKTTDITSPQTQLVTEEGAVTSGSLVASIVRDNAAPVAVDDPGNSTVSGGSTTIDVTANDTDADGDALAPTNVSSPAGGTATVNPDGTITYTANAGFAGSDTFTYTASDGFTDSANAASVTVTVTDTTKPTLTVPSGTVTAEATGPAGAAVTYAATASDNIPGAIDPVCDPPSGSTFGVGTTTVTCTATDAAGNTTDASFDVTVADTTAPTIGDVPSDRTVEATGPGGATVSYTPPTATDLVDGAVAVDCEPPSGSTFHLGANTVSCTATDSAGNTTSETFTITVEDTAPPVLDLPADMTVFSSTGDPISVTYSATATDVVDGAVGVTCTPASGSTFAAVSTVVDCTATDAAGNTAHGTFTVTVVPNRPPSCTDVHALGVANLWPVNHKLVLITLSGATDPDGNTLSYRIDGVTQDEPVTGGGSGNTAFDAQRASGGAVYLRSERAGSGDGRVYTIAYTVTDQYGLSCSSTIDVKVRHDAAHDAVKSPASSNSFGV